MDKLPSAPNTTSPTPTPTVPSKSGHSGFCVPTIIAIVIGVLGIVGSMVAVVRAKKDKDPNSARDKALKSLAVTVLVNVAMVGLMYFLCRTGHDTIAWILLLLPLIFLMVVLFMFVGLIDIIKDSEEKYRPVLGWYPANGEYGPFIVNGNDIGIIGDQTNQASYNGGLYNQGAILPETAPGQR